MSLKDTAILTLLVVNSVAIGWLVATRQDAPAPTDPDVDRQLEVLAARLETVEDRANSRSSDRSRSRLGAVEDRLAELETAVGPMRVDAPSGGGAAASGESDDESLSAKERKEATKAVVEEFKKAKIAELGEATASAMKMYTGLKLRMLPEEERWEKLRAALGIGSAHEEELRLAIAIRADEFGAATTRDEATEDGYRVTTTEVDVERVEAADRAFWDVFERTLSTEQQKAWKDGAWSEGMLRGRPKAGTERKQIE